MKKLIASIRCLIAETFLGWALIWTPKDSDEELAICLAIRTYQDTLKEKEKTNG